MFELLHQQSLYIFAEVTLPLLLNLVLLLTVAPRNIGPSHFCTNISCISRVIFLSLLTMVLPLNNRSAVPCDA
jgi:hypothetical protein